MLTFLTNLAALGAGAFIGSQAALRASIHQSPRPMPHQVAGLLDHPLRLRYRDPAETLGLFGVSAGMTVLELGCGSGLFTVEMAQMVGEQGKVHAVDIQASLVEQTIKRAMEAGVGERVQTHHSGVYELPLPDECIDLAVAVATLGEIPNCAAGLQEIARVLKPVGRLAVSEELPDPAYVPARTVRRWAEEAGFRFLGKTGSFFCYHAIFIK